MSSPGFQPDLTPIHQHRDQLLAAIEQEEARVQARYPIPEGPETGEEGLAEAIAAVRQHPRSTPVDVAVTTRWQLAVESLHRQGLLSNAEAAQARGPINALPSSATLDRVDRQAHRARIRAAVERSHELAAARAVRSAVNMVHDHALAGKVAPDVAEALLLNLSDHWARRRTAANRLAAQATRPQRDPVRLADLRVRLARRTHQMAQALSNAAERLFAFDERAHKAIGTVGLALAERIDAAATQVPQWLRALRQSAAYGLARAQEDVRAWRRAAVRPAAYAVRRARAVARAADRMAKEVRDQARAEWGLTVARIRLVQAQRTAVKEARRAITQAGTAPDGRIPDFSQSLEDVRAAAAAHQAARAARHRAPP